VNLFYFEKGSGYPVVFLHGFPFDHHLCDPLLPYLPEGFRYIFPDLRGFGKSPSTESDYSMAVMASDVIQLMDKINVQCAILIGHSMGGYLALEITRQIQTRISGIGLVASHIYSDTPEGKANRLNLIRELNSSPVTDVFAAMPENLSTNLTVQEYCRNAIKNANVAGLQGALRAMAMRTSSESLWAALSIPKLIIAGTDDQFIPIDISQTIAHTGGDAIFKVIKNAGHMVIFEYPAETAAELENFILQVSRE